MSMILDNLFFFLRYVVYLLEIFQNYRCNFHQLVLKFSLISLYGKRLTIYPRSSLLNILELHPEVFFYTSKILNKNPFPETEIWKKQLFSILFSSKIKRNINLNAVRVGKSGRWKIDLKYVTGVFVELYFTEM